MDPPVIKAILLGDKGVGKTTIINEIYKDYGYENSPHYHTSTENYSYADNSLKYIEKIVEIENKKYILQLWDDPEDYLNREKLYENAKIVVFVFGGNDVFILFFENS